MSVANTLETFVRNLTRWNQELSTGDTRSTLLSGIAGKAAVGFENLLRKCLADFLALTGLSYETELAPDFPGKSLGKLTLGEVVQSLDKLGRKFSRVLGKDVLLRKAHKRRLAEITALRNMLQHREDDFAPDKATLKKNTAHLLSLIQQELAEPLFTTAVQGPQRAEISR
jgi:hypothetical protein